MRGKDTSHARQKLSSTSLSLLGDVTSQGNLGLAMVVLMLSPPSHLPAFLSIFSYSHHQQQLCSLIFEAPGPRKTSNPSFVGDLKFSGRTGVGPVESPAYLWASHWPGHWDP